MKLPSITLNFFYKVGTYLFGVIFLGQGFWLLHTWGLVHWVQSVIQVAQLLFTFLLMCFFASQYRDEKASGEPLSPEELKRMYEK